MVHAPDAARGDTKDELLSGQSRKIAPQESRTNSDASDSGKPKETLSIKPSSFWLGVFRLPGAIQSKPYEEQQLSAYGGTEPYKFRVQSDLLSFGRTSLPDGMSLSEDGLISGTPNRSGTYVFKVSVEDKYGEKGSQHYSLAVALDLGRYHLYSDHADGDYDVLAKGNGPTSICHFDHIRKDSFPLLLCEFLAYKSAEAYGNDEARNANDRLIERLKHNPELVKHYRFFDSNKPMLEPPARWDCGDDANKKHGVLCRCKVCQINKQRKALDTQAFGFVFEGKAFIICRGTVSLRDWRVDVDNALTTEADKPPSILEKLKSGIGLRRKRERMTPSEKILIGPDNLAPARAIGFAAVWAAIQDEVEDWLEHEVPKETQQEFVFSGHSLGGALAFVGAREFAKMGRRIFAVVTFGAPCVGVEAPKEERAKSEPDASLAPASYDTSYFVDEYRTLQNGELWDRTIRLQTDSDAVPKLMAIKGFVHVGREWLIEFPPLPSSSTLWKRALLTRPLLHTSRFLLRNNMWVENSWPGKGLGYAILYAGPFLLKVVSAHSATHRYAMFLSALSYRKIRAINTGGFEVEDKRAFMKSSSDLNRHLEMVRGPASRPRPGWFAKRFWPMPRQIQNKRQEDSLTRKYYGPDNTEFLF